MGTKFRDIIVILFLVAIASAPLRTLASENGCNSPGMLQAYNIIYARAQQLASVGSELKNHAEQTNKRVIGRNNLDNVTMLLGTSALSLGVSNAAVTGLKTLSASAMLNLRSVVGSAVSGFAVYKVSSGAGGEAKPYTDDSGKCILLEREAGKEETFQAAVSDTLISIQGNLEGAAIAHQTAVTVKNLPFMIGLYSRSHMKVYREMKEDLEQVANYKPGRTDQAVEDFYNKEMKQMAAGHHLWMAGTLSEMGQSVSQAHAVGSVGEFVKHEFGHLPYADQVKLEAIRAHFVCVRDEFQELAGLINKMSGACGISEPLILPSGINVARRTKIKPTWYGGLWDKSQSHSTATNAR